MAARNSLRRETRFPMPTEKVTTFFKEAHATELDRMYKLDGMVNFPAAIITVLVGVGVHFLQNLPELSFSWVPVLFVTLLGASGLCLLASVYFLAKSYWRQKYDYLASPESYRQAVETAHAQYAEFPMEGKTAEESVDAYFQQNVLARYAECATVNRARNKGRIDDLYRATAGILCALPLLLLAAVPYYYLRNPPAKVQQVEVVKPIPK